MELVASSGNVKIYCPSNGRLSFFNSPYPAHRGCSGIDIYPGSSFNEVTPSPVAGEVSMIRRVRCPANKRFKASNFDYVILLRSFDDERIIKILHVDPIVEVGEEVKPGQDLGFLIRSGYFDFWTDPHIHVEVRRPSDPIRARGGYMIRREMVMDYIGSPPENIVGRVVTVKPEYILLSLRGHFKYGVPVEVGGSVGVLDAGIPHYRWIGVHHVDDVSGGVIRLCDVAIGRITVGYMYACLAEKLGFAVKCGMVNVGLSFYLHPCSEPLLKVIPSKPGMLSLREGEEVSIEITQ